MKRKIALAVLAAAILFLIHPTFGQQATQHGDFVTWTASATPGVTYVVYRAPSTNGVCGAFASIATGVTGTSFLDPAGTSAQPGTAYCYEVDAENSSNALSGPSNVVTLTTPATFPINPNPPTGVAVTPQ